VVVQEARGGKGGSVRAGYYISFTEKEKKNEFGRGFYTTHNSISSDESRVC